MLPAPIRLLRPHQWVKNVFVAAPLFFTPSVMSLAVVYDVLLAVLSFCFAAGAVYIINDYNDRESDKLHPEKKNRPLASGEVSDQTAVILCGVMLVLSAVCAIFVSHWLVVIVAIYFALNLAYSLKLKHVAILDVMIIAMGFVLRLEAGSIAIDVRNSEWIIMCVGLLALFLAIAKRRDDVVKKLSVDHRASLDGYTRRFLDIALAVVLSSVLVAYMIYTTDVQVQDRLGTDRLYMTVPFVVAGVLRYLQITFVEERSGSPTLIVLTDKFLIITILGWIATFGVLMYG